MMALRPSPCLTAHRSPARPAAAALILIAILAVPALAAAQPAVGIHWDAGFTTDTLPVTAAPQMVTGYLVLHDVPAAGLLGWELAVATSGTATITGWDIMGQHINAATPPSFAVGFDAPRPPQDGALLLAGFTCFLPDTAMTAFAVGPIATPSLPGAMAFIPADDPQALLPMTPISGRAEVAWINPAPRLDLTALDFGEVLVGGDATLDFTITNPGSAPLAVDIALAGSCAGFTLPEVAGPHEIAGGGTLTVPVRFAPVGPGAATCTVTCGDPRLSVDLAGVGDEAYVLMSYPIRVEWGETSIRTIVSSQNIVVANHGTLPQAINPTVTDCADGIFTVIRQGGARVLQPGEQIYLGLSFTPDEPIAYECQLVLAPELRPITLVGIGVEDTYEYTVPEEVDFGSVRVGEFVEFYVRITNLDWYFLGIDPFVSGCGNNFTITAGGGSRSIPGYGIGSVRVRFQPQTVGDVACQFYFASWLDPVAIRGRGLDPDAAWTVTPTVAAFPYTPPGASSDLTVQLCNTGDQPMDLDVALGPGAPEFSLADGGGSHLLAPFACHDVTLHFAPAGAGSFAGTLVFGAGLPAVPIRAFTGALPDSCGLSTDTLEFGSIPVGDTLTRPFTVTNTSGQTFRVEPVSDSPAFVVEGVARNLAPGESVSYTVSFRPGDEGPQAGTITTGDPICPVVTCTGEAYEIPNGDPNRLGIYFNGSFTRNHIDLAPFETAEAALVLLNPTDPYGVWGWECKVSMIGDAVVLGWDLEGQALNIAQPPEFVVGISRAPLPWDQAVRLATFDVMVMDDSAPVYFEVGPTSLPSLPGQMAWAPRDEAQLIAMTPVTGQPVVAAINGTVAVDRLPAPLAVVTGGRLELSWQLPDEPGATCHVHRRRGGAEPQRLNDVPLPVTGGRLVYHDDVSGFADGTTLFYSYTVVRGGVESAPSAEAAVTVRNLLPALTRLLPNVPNPFNPSTGIRFELERPAAVDLAVYDIAGRRVRELARESFAAGTHARTWDGRDGSGRRVASGVYYVRLATERKLDHLKILLLK